MRRQWNYRPARNGDFGLAFVLRLKLIFQLELAICGAPNSPRRCSRLAHETTEPLPGKPGRLSMRARIPTAVRIGAAALCGERVHILVP
jgi:hypothetical protein